jgi:hypothetical protein
VNLLNMKKILPGTIGQTKSELNDSIVSNVHNCQMYTTAS